MNEVLAQLLATQTVVTPDGRRLPLHSHLPPLEGEILQAWLCAYAPQRVLEVGLAYGISALFICDALLPHPEVTYDIVDPYQERDWAGCGIANLARAGYAGRYRLHQEASELCLPRLLAEGRRFDFAFIDGFHTFDHALVDFFYINRMLEVGGVVIFDDVTLPSLQKLVAYVAGYPCYAPLALPERLRSHRTLRLRRMMNVPLSRMGGFVKQAVDDRGWDWYHDF